MSSDDYARYNENDTLESAEDLSSLFEVLYKHKDRNGRPAVITAVAVVANPDFEKIKASGFTAYSWESASETYKRYGHAGVDEVIREGIAKQLFIPQFHGREHLNVSAWMRALQNKDREATLAFEHGCWGYNNKNQFGVKYQAAFDLEFPDDLEGQHEIIRTGLDHFEELFGYKAVFFVPPNGPYNIKLSATTRKHGIQYISLAKKHASVLGEGKTSLSFNWLGKKDPYGQKVITRNSAFEPGQDPANAIDKCMKQAEAGFMFNKPVVISTHRVNYIGSLNHKNRDLGLNQLSELLSRLLQRWPDIEFITSHELGDIIVKAS
jgi:hypothetical protein